MLIARVLTLALVVTACVPAVQSARSVRPTPPDETFTCYMRELAFMEYRVEDSDRESGFIRAFKEETGVLFSGEYGNEATIIIIESDPGSEVNVTMRRVRIDSSGGRSTMGMSMSGDAQAELAALQSACT